MEQIEPETTENTKENTNESGEADPPLPGNDETEGVEIPNSETQNVETANVETRNDGTQNAGNEVSETENADDPESSDPDSCKDPRNCGQMNARLRAIVQETHKTIYFVNNLLVKLASLITEATGSSIPRAHSIARLRLLINELEGRGQDAEQLNME